MDPQVRQFKDFLSLYNTITEKCFNSCVDNILSRNVENNEVRSENSFRHQNKRQWSLFQNSCILYCVDKFAKVNQRLMGTYVEVQSKINEKRMVEYENQLKAAEELAKQQQQEQLAQAQPTVEATN
jgi:mitochondrial import inner membrane translocase subunit TIM10B